jgi:hypothetical protein
LPANDAVVKREKAGIPPAAIVIFVVVIAGAGGFLYLNRIANRAPAGPPPLTADARTYVHSLALSDVNMKANTTYLNQQVVEITGNIRNNGDRKLSVVEVNCVFYDPYGQLVLRERVPIVGKRMGGLSPGETKQFRLPFDTIPDSWNQAMPQLVIAQIQFQ